MSFLGFVRDTSREAFKEFFSPLVDGFKEPFRFIKRHRWLVLPILVILAAECLLAIFCVIQILVTR